MDIKNRKKEIGDKIKSVREAKGLTLYAIESKAALELRKKMRWVQAKSVEEGIKQYSIDTLLLVLEVLDLEIEIKEKPAS